MLSKAADTSAFEPWPRRHSAMRRKPIGGSGALYRS